MWPKTVITTSPIKRERISRIRSSIESSRTRFHATVQIWVSRALNGGDIRYLTDHAGVVGAVGDIAFVGFAGDGPCGEVAVCGGVGCTEERDEEGGGFHSLFDVMEGCYVQVVREEGKGRDVCVKCIASICKKISDRGRGEGRDGERVCMCVGCDENVDCARHESR